MRVYFSGGPQKKHSTAKRGTYNIRGIQIAAMRENWSTEWTDGCYPVDVFVMVGVEVETILSIEITTKALIPQRRFSGMVSSAILVE